MLARQLKLIIIGMQAQKDYLALADPCFRV